MERLQAMVDDWRRNALEALAAEDYRADVDQYLEASVDARLYLLARPALRRHEIGMIKSTPQKLIVQGTDWRFLHELKKELKG